MSRRGEIATMTSSSSSRTSAVNTPSAPEPVGPYSQALRCDDLLFLSGQIPLNPDTGKLVGGEIEDQTRQVLTNLREVLEAGGSSLQNVVKTTVYLTDLSLFPRVNATYSEFFASEPFPARATVEVAALPLGAEVEIEAIARITQSD